MAAPVISGYMAHGRFVASSPVPGDTARPIVLDPTTGYAGSPGVVGSPLAVGDWMIVAFTGSGGVNATQTPTAPSDWQVLVPFGGVGSGSTTFGVWAKQRLAGETTYNWTIDASTVPEDRNVATAYSVFWVTGASDPENWTIGNFRTRQENTPVVTTAATAPSVTTNGTDNLVLFLAGERTAAAETADQVAVSGAGFTKLITSLQGGDQTLTAAQATVATTGTTVGPVTITYPNPHNFNAIAGLISIPSSAPPPPVTVPPTLSGYLNYGRLLHPPQTPGDTAHPVEFDPIRIAEASGQIIGDPLKAGDWMIVVMTSSSTGSNTQTPTASADWTVLHPFGQVGSGTMCFGVWAKQRLAGETTYDWTVDASRGAVCEYQTFWLSGAKDVSAWTVGQFAFREDNATTTSTVAPAVTTAEGSNYVMHISGERTRAEETGDQITVSGTGFTKDIHAVIGDRTTTVSSSTVEAASETVGPVTTTYPNAHNFNGIAGLIVVPGSSSATPTGLAIRRSNGSTLEVAYLKVSDGGGNLMTPGGLKVVKPGYASVDSMLSQETFYIAHRGGSRFFPEMSLYAYGQSVLLGYGALEFSMARTSDGVWFGLHDRSLDRTSGVSGLPDASNMTWAQVQNYQILGSMAADAPSQPNRPYMRLEELLDLYYPSHVIFMDTKYAGGYIGEFVNIMSSLPGTPQNHIVSKSFGVGPGLHGPMRAAGFMAWGYYYQSNVTSGDFAAWQSSFDILGMEYGADAASWSAATSTGKPVIGHICPTTAAAATALGRGARGLICSGVKLIQTPYPYT